MTKGDYLPFKKSTKGKATVFSDIVQNRVSKISTSLSTNFDKENESESEEDT